MRKFRKSTTITWGMLVYVSLTAVYFLPRNTTISDMEKYITLAVSYAIVLLLWFVLRKKEQLQNRRREEEEQIEIDNNKLSNE